VIEPPSATPLPSPLAPEPPAETAAPSPSESATPRPLPSGADEEPIGLAPAAIPPTGGGETPPEPAPAQPEHPVVEDGGGVLSHAWQAITSNVSRAVSPEAAAKVATSFGFPLGLMIAVIVFLVVQDQVDRRDPKLRSAPRTYFDTIVRFKEEHEL
jgi:hypothetical protein